MSARLTVMSCENRGENGTYFTEKLRSNDISMWILFIYFANVIVGAILNLFSFIAISRSKRNGTFSIIQQLSATDILSTCVCFVEIWSLKNNTWPFPSELCPIFSGLEVLTSTLTLYLIIALNFHTISLCNMRFHEGEPTNKNPLTSCDASNECLVRDSRNVTIDYRNRKMDLPITIPCILIWFACLSLSIPQFTLSSTVKNFVTSKITCAIIDVHYGKLLENLLITFRVYVPMVLMTLSFIILCLKMYENLKNNAMQNIFTKKSHNISYYLIFCLVLNVTYLLTSMQRSVFYAVHTNSSIKNMYDSFSIIIYYNECSSHNVMIVLAMLHYVGTYLRFLICLFLLPKFKSLILNKILTCFNRKS